MIASRAVVGDLAGKDSAGSNPNFTTANVSFSSISHMSSVVPLGDEFGGFVVLI